MQIAFRLNMSEKYFDENILKDFEKKNNSSSTMEDYSKLTYHFRKDGDFYTLHCEINSERLTVGELGNLLKINETKKFLTQSDVQLLNYLIHKLGSVQTIYKISNDIEIIFSYLEDTNCTILFYGEPVLFAKDEYKLNMKLFLDENSNVTLEITDKGEFLFGLNSAYFVSDKKINVLNPEIPIKFYKEIVEGNNKFSIESFFSIKGMILGKLQNTQNLKISKEVEDLAKMQIEEKTAKTVLVIARSAHFIGLNLKYKVGNEYFNIEDYRYLETSTWVDFENLIKIIRENDKLVQYRSDESLSVEIFDELFDGIRIKYSRNDKTPFNVIVPIANLEMFVKRVLPRAEEMFEIEYKDGKRLTLSEGRVYFEVDTSLRRNLNLFEFKVKFKIGEEYFDLDFVKELMLKSKKYVQLKDGSTFNVENIREINKWIEFLNRFEFKRKDDTYKTESTTALELDEFLRDIEGKEVKSNEEYKELIMELKDRKPVEKIEIPEIVDSILRDYQKEGVYWLHFLKKYGFGGILADEMGLGKTVQALTILKMNEGQNHLVVCPKSLIYNWENEIKKYFPEMKVLIVDKDSERRKALIKTAKQYDVIITSYSMVQKDYSHYIDNDIKFNYAILDEAHYVKNMKTLSSKAVRLIPSERKILLTGTPLENNLEELYGTFELIMPGYLGSKLDFRRDFVSKIERNNLISLEILQAKIRPFILRRTKKEVLKELPDKQEQIVYNEMTNKQVAVYNEVLNRVKSEVNQLIEKQGFAKSRIQVLSALLRLRQICNHPSLLDSSFASEQDISGKYEQFKELLTEVVDSGDKVLVFSQFTSMLNIFEKDLDTLKINYLRLDGSTKNRQDVVDQFNNDEKVKVFLISLKAGGVGLNLTAASAVFLYDPWWNPMAEQQAVDRAHRIGQKKTVNIYKFITRNSIEEKILKLQERKGNLFENLVVEDNGFVKRLEWEDLMELFD